MSLSHLPARTTSRGRRPRAAALGLATLALGVAALAGAAGLSGAAQAADTDHAASAVTVHSEVTPQAATSSYWTSARLAAAKPADVMTVSKDAAPAGSTTDVRPTGKSGRAAGTAPAAQAAAVSPAATIANGLVSPSLYTTYPVSMNGKVFFTFNGGNYVCSGTSVTAFYNGVQASEVWTAGHCLANTTTTNPNTWSSNVLFIPGYNAKGTTYAAQEPFGRFASTGATVATKWLTSADRTVDFGAFRVGTSNTGRVLYSAVGAAGFMWNASTTQTFDAFGYPQAAPYDGTQMYHYRGATSSTYTVPGGSGGPQIAMVNPMTGGSSGGAWFVGWSYSNPSTSGYINGHNDWKYDSGHVYSPYFNTLANTVRCQGLSSC